ncbi:hypothetical protein CSUB01_05621 [Colletotrichum sublineola]|uniref:Uncharacterized protein n=1 Tax=Colletotrichum sublineola TaxID=1173701 RepID=A0A066XIG7_COLSU|nr:hypothetical protein CSUB01_05621 [Colletotrichum sublineola]
MDVTDARVGQASTISRPRALDELSFPPAVWYGRTGPDVYASRRPAARPYVDASSTKIMVYFHDSNAGAGKENGEQLLISRNLANGRGRNTKAVFEVTRSELWLCPNTQFLGSCPCSVNTLKKCRPICLLPAISSRQPEQPRPATSRGAEISGCCEASIEGRVDA